MFILMFSKRAVFLLSKILEFVFVWAFLVQPKISVLVESISDFRLFLMSSIFWDNSSSMFDWCWGIIIWVRQCRHAQKHPLMFPTVLKLSFDRSVQLTWNHLRHLKNCMLNSVQFCLNLLRGKCQQDVFLVVEPFLWGIISI